MKYKLNCTAWPEPYAEVLLETASEGLLKILAATEITVFKRLWELVAGQSASVLFCAQVAPRCSVRSRSKQIGEDRVFQNAAERRIVNSQSLPILDVTELLELIHEVADAASS